VTPYRAARPLVSIITPSFNQAAFVEQTILSVVNQRGVNIEHIVVDGKSTDGTVDILRRYPHLNWISEADRGQTDALNKGLARASGEIVGWINSDDYYVDNILSDVAQAFRDPGTQWVVGNLTFVYEATGEHIETHSPPINLAALLADPDIVRQQPTFFRRDFLMHAGGWDPRYHMIMDYELWVRLARISTPRMIDANWAYFRIHDAQKTSRGNLLRQLRELVQVMRREGARPAEIRRLRRMRALYYAKATLKSALISVGLLNRRYGSRPMRLPTRHLSP
jgi:glycosyltransferase involved in cell wall biosynthesis